MKQYHQEVTIGMDLGNKKHEICILDTESGELLGSASIDNNMKAIEEYFTNFPDSSKAKVIMEAGTHSPWISNLLTDKGFEVLVCNPRKLRMIWDTDNKNDKRDAEMLARIGRADSTLLYPIKHRNVEAHRDLNLIKCRDGLVKCRTALVNMIRGMLKSQGFSVPASSTECFTVKVREIISKELYLIYRDMLESIDDLSLKIKRYDKYLDKLCRKKYPETDKLRQIKGVGPVTSLAFILILEDYNRFEKSRDVGPYIGLVPRRDQSGDTDKQLSITKAGNNYLRSLLVSSAHYILGPFGEDSDLRRYGLRRSERGGKAAKKKAVVAVARKLGVLLHKLWETGEIYEPLRNSKKNGKRKKNVA